MAGSGVASLGTFPHIPPSGPPFSGNSAHNGVSVDSPAGKVVLGNDKGDLTTPAILLNNREIPTGILGTSPSMQLFLNGNIRFGFFNSADSGQRVQIDGNLRVGTFIQESFVTTNYFNTNIGTPPGVTTASNNYITGFGSMPLLTSGTRNIIIGTQIMPISLTGAANIAFGNNSMSAATSASGNFAMGEFVLDALTSGADNIQLGRNTPAVGVTTGNQNILIGAQTNAAGNLTTANKNILLGHGIDPPGNVNGFVSIGNIIFATNAVGLGTTISGSVGVGTAAPAAKFHVNDPALWNVHLGQPTADVNQALNIQSITNGAFDGIKVWAQNLTTFSQIGFVGMSTNGTMLLNSNGASVQLQTVSATRFTADATGITTEDPGSGAAAWRLGTKIAAATVFDATHYVEVKIAGTVVKLACVN